MTAETSKRWGDRLRAVEANREIERLTAERDKAMIDANAADARVVAVARENADLKRELAKGGDRVYAPDGRTWQAFAYAEAAKRGELQEEVARLRAALGQMVYETTHLSPLENDGSHWCRISKEALAQAREALADTARSVPTGSGVER